MSHRCAFDAPSDGLAPTGRYRGGNLYGDDVDTEPLNPYPPTGDVQRPSGDHARTHLGQMWDDNIHIQAHDDLDRLTWTQEPQVRALLIMHQPSAWIQAKEYTLMLREMQAWVGWLSVRRDEAVRQLRREGASYNHVANALGISKSRAQALCVRLENKSS